MTLGTGWLFRSEHESLEAVAAFLAGIFKQWHTSNPHAAFPTPIMPYLDHPRQDPTNDNSDSTSCLWNDAVASQKRTTKTSKTSKSQASFGCAGGDSRILVVFVSWWCLGYPRASALRLRSVLANRPYRRAANWTSPLSCMLKIRCVCGSGNGLAPVNENLILRTALPALVTTPLPS
jgi:hypothetical protein